MGTLPQALKIIFEVKMKRNNEKLARRKNKLSNLQKTFFFLFGHLLLSNFQTSSFSYSFKMT
jgi:hypothetical protein